MGLGTPATADYQAGVDAYSNRDFKGAMAEWLPLAESGDATAQNSVGALYDHGLGVDEDDATAAHWYQLAADQNFPLAMRNLANMYAGGYGVPFDMAQAESWYEKAAQLGDPVAIKRMAALRPTSEFAAAATALEPVEPVPAPAAEPMTVAGDDLPAEAPPVPETPQLAEPAPAPAPEPEPAPAVETPAPTVAEVDPDQAPQYGDVGALAPAAGEAPAPAPDPAPALATTQQAAITPPPPPAATDPGNWLIGMWQGPSLGCPPGGGLEFAPGETRSYYGGQVAATLQAQYEVAGERVTVTTTGVDGVGHSYEYERRGPNTFVITAVPPDMPSSMIGIEHQRCSSAPLAAAAAPTPEANSEAAEPQEAEPEVAAPAPVAKPFVPTAPEPTAQPAPDAVPEEPVGETAQPEPMPAPQVAAKPEDAAPGSPQAGWDAFGRGDYEGALAVWKPLAENGDVSMQLLVGSIYDFGQGVPQDDAEAVKWYERAAEQGSAKGQYQAGAVYARSAQIKDPVQGYKWLTIAARSLASGPQGGVTADQATTLRTLLQGEMSEAEIAKAKQEADSFKAKKD
jgi:TPR repeat protein